MIFARPPRRGDRLAALSVYVVALCSLLLLSGCETAKDTWKSTANFYDEYVDTDPMINLEEDVDVEDADRKLGQLITPVDVRLESLVRFIDANDAFPTDQWVSQLFEGYPWLSGLVVTDNQGGILLKKTLVPLKPLDVAPFLAIKPTPSSEILEGIDAEIEKSIDEGMDESMKEGMRENLLAALPPVWADRKMRARYEITPLGPEIYIAQPFFKENEWAGLIVVHFDLGPLLKFCPDPEELLILTPDDVIWAGKYDRVNLSLTKAPLKEMIVDNVTGEWEDDEDREYRWLARFVGDMRLIYAVFTD